MVARSRAVNAQRRWTRTCSKRAGRSSAHGVRFASKSFVVKGSIELSWILLPFVSRGLWKSTFSSWKFHFRFFSPFFPLRSVAKFLDLFRFAPRLGTNFFAKRVSTFPRRFSELEISWTNSRFLARENKQYFAGRFSERRLRSIAAQN